MKVYKVSAKKSVEELFLMIPKSHSVHPPPFCRGVEPPTKFSKMVGLTGPQPFEGGCWERGDDFFQGGGLQFLHEK